MLKEIDHWIEADLYQPFNTRRTFSIGGIQTNSKPNGMHYPFYDKLFNAIEIMENQYGEIRRFQ